ncbi:MAG: SEL1-like repeat protein [Alphaproteobacteria bacterium]|nr:SEL1-like repeat protein [Alphaproteobacteria bacterium]
MTIQDDHAARDQEFADGIRSEFENGSDENVDSNVLAQDMRSILKLIATQIEDVDRRHTKVLGEVQERLQSMSEEASATRQQVPAAYAPAFERIQDGIQLLTGLVAESESGSARNAPGAGNQSGDQSPADTAPRSEPAAQTPIADAPSLDLTAQEATGVCPSPDAQSEDSDPFLNQQPEPLGHACDTDMSTDDMVITDNAADRWDFDDEDLTPAGTATDGDNFGSHSSKPASDASSDQALIGNQDDEALEDAAKDGDAPQAVVDTVEAKPTARAEPPVFASIPGNVDQDWSETDAEALTQVYEAVHEAYAAKPQAARQPEAGVSSQALFAAAPSVAEAPAAPVAAPSPVIETQPSQPCSKACISEIAPAIEQAWLEERFADIADKIQDALSEIRDDSALNDLSSRFGEFEQRLGSALEDVATRNDLEALKSAETQIDSMVGYFERVESQLGRIDNLEAQLEAIMDRVSDDHLMQLFAQNAPQSGDYEKIADAAAANAAQRFLTDFGGSTKGAGVEDLRDALTAFMEERRLHDNESAGMLDTIQQALIRVLDRVDVLEGAAPYPEMTAENDFGKPAAPAPQATYPGDLEQGFEPEADQQPAKPEAAIANAGFDTELDPEFDPEFDPVFEPEPAPAPQTGFDQGPASAHDFNSDSDLESDFAPTPSTVNEPAPAPSMEEGKSNLRPERRERDYSQTQLEYPAAVMGATASAAPETETETATETEAAMAPAAVFEDPIVPAGFPEEEGQRELVNPHAAAGDVPNTDDVPTRILTPESADLDTVPAQAYDDPSHQLPQANEDGDWQQKEEQPRGSAIDRLRQEFIQDAKRARERAAEQALADEQNAHSQETPGRKIKLPGLSKIGLKGLGGRKEAADPQITPELPGSTHAVDTDVTATATADTPKSRLSLPKSKLLVGAVIVLFATAGALLMMRDKTQTANVEPPAPIERQLQGSASGPELAGPEDNGPEVTGDHATNAPGPQGRLDGGRVYEGGFNYDVPAGSTKTSAMTLDGVAVAELDKAPDPRKLADARRHRALAKMSSDLGAAAAYATPASLMPDKSIQQAALGTDSSVASARKGNQLNLPPATVGPLSLRLAAAKGDPSAQFEVAARLAGGTGTKQNLKEAVRWYSRSAAQGFAQAHYRLGTLYERGLGVEKDLARSSLWYQRAAAKGNVKAMHNLAVVSAGSQAGGPDYKTAARWFGQAADYGLADSQFNMAVLFENGLGVEKDLKKAYLYYSLAAHQGDEQAVKRRDEVRAQLSPTVLSKVDSQIKNFRPKKSDKVVNDARAAGEDWKKRADHSYNR